MTPTEVQYKSTTTRLACSMLFFLALFFLYSLTMSFLFSLTEQFGFWGDIIYQLVYGVFYAAVFILPVFFFGWISGKKPREAICFTKTLPRATPLYLFVGLAIITAAAYLNSFLLEFFDYSSFMQDMFYGEELNTNYQIILMFFTTAVVPAFVEELLFRGLVLTNLLPYGRNTAILGSALLFGMMHQNAGQLFYATIAGLVLGYLYVKTRSIWCGVLLHFVNNFLSIFQSICTERLSSTGANLVIGILEMLIFSLGMTSFVWLLLRTKDRKAEIRLSGAFSVSLPADEDYAAIEIPAGRRVRLFFNVPMIIFFVVCALMMVIYLTISVFWRGL